MSGARIVAVEAVPLTARFADLYGGEAAIPASILRPAAHFTGAPRTGQYATLVSITTDDGLTGHGEAWGLPLPEATALWIERLVAPALLGRDAGDIEGIADELTDYFARVGHRESIAAEALSGVDLALWDLAGRRAGRSVADLLGRRRDRVDCYVSPIMFAATQTETRDAARAFADEGFRGVKMKAGRGVERDVADARAVRDAVGPGVALLVDVNGGYALDEATRLAEGLEALGVHWLEEPLRPEAIGDTAELRRRTAIPIALGENDFTIERFAVLLARGLADIVMPNVTRAGGLTGCRRIAALAAAHGARFSLHGVGTGVMQHASLQLLAALDSPALFEVNRFPNPLRDALTPAVAIEDGRMVVPDGAGLGCAIDAAAVARFGPRG